MTQHRRNTQRWLQEHVRDPYVKKAKRCGYRSRAIYKLLALQKQYHLFKPGMMIVDLGAAPGSWSQFLSECVKQTGKIIAIDVLAMQAIDNVVCIQGDLLAAETVQAARSVIMAHSATAHVDWVVSDMAPNMSGISSVDQAHSFALLEQALVFALQILHVKGSCLFKAFQGDGFDLFFKKLTRLFQTVVICKPEASRKRSKEVYLLARTLF